MKKPIKKGSVKENYVPNNNPMSGVFDIPGMGGFQMNNIVANGGGPGFGNGRVTPLSEPWEMIYSSSYYLLSTLRTVLTYAYTIHGPLRTLVDLPVYDAFRGGITIKSDEVSPEEIEDLQRTIRKIKLIRKVIDGMRWSRLYGGAGIIINTDQDFSKLFDVSSISQDSKLDFIVADRWQLQWQGNPFGRGSKFIYNPGGDYAENNILVATIDPSRVVRIVGETAPALIKQRLLGWDMSVIECVIREINLYFKENNVLFELIDEAKIDVWKIDGFNANMLNKKAAGITAMRIQLATWMKNFLNAITLDMKDDYIQKQVTFSGMAEVMKQIQIGIAAACRMPVAKIFGLSATGFDSGESDLETYNAIVETEREKADEVWEAILPPLMMKLWGFVPDDWSVEYKPLRVLKATDEMAIKMQQYTIDAGLFQAGILNPQEYCAKLKEDGILLMETEVSKGAEPEPPMSAMAEMGMDEGGTAAPKAAGAKGKQEKAKEG